MRSILHYAAAITLLLTAVSCSERKQEPLKIEPVSFAEVDIDDAFWSPRLKAHKEVTIPVCIDQIENQTGRIRNFENAAKGEGEHSGIFFDDSDVYKALEGMAYSLQTNPDPELEAKCDEWIDKFAAAQQPDGYINTYFTLTGLENRWHNMDKHEMYCAGHMIEAAVAYYNVTGKDKFLGVCERMADHMMSVFGPGKRDWVPGHEEIELALVKLYRTTGKKEYLDFADWLLSERGHGYGSYGDDRSWPVHYYQDEVPVRDMRSLTGHAVRSMYLYCGMADVASITGDAGYMEAMDSLWTDVVERNMYITGGIGQSSSNEGFTDDWSLPNLTAYCETCASVGMVIWNWRMNRAKGDSRYADVMERALYNGALAGISLAGDRFFYVNPLESVGNHHRQAWYGCACCPSQICRFLPSIGNYIYNTSKDAIWVNLFIGNHAQVEVDGKTVDLSMQTSYPWDGNVTLTVGNAWKGALRIRIPDWCSECSLKVNGQDADSATDRGYAVIDRKWKSGDKVELAMDMPVVPVSADPRVKEDLGKRAIQRGPVVYCLEEVDNPSIAQATLSADTQYSTAFEPSLLGGVETVTATDGAATLRFIPYYAWDNREAGAMKVWIDYNE